MSTVLMGLGPHRFGIAQLAYNELERTWRYRWEPLNRVGRRPAMQYLGPGEEIVVLPGVIYPHYYGGFDQLERMRSDAARGAKLPMASGLGRFHGIWGITEIKDKQAYFLPNGAPRKVEFNISLTHYGPDGAGFGNFIF